MSRRQEWEGWGGAPMTPRPKNPKIKLNKNKEMYCRNNM